MVLRAMLDHVGAWRRRAAGVPELWRPARQGAPVIFPALIMLSAWAIGGTPAIQCEPAQAWATDPVATELHQPLAYTNLRERRAVLSPYVCGGAVLLVADPAGTWLKTVAEPHGWIVGNTAMREAHGLFALLHESYHLSRAPAYSPSDEHAADCFALAKMPAALELLHVPPARATELLGYATALHNAEPAPYAGACT
jgi:hypothetical protein